MTDRTKLTLTFTYINMHEKKDVFKNMSVHNNIYDICDKS